MVRDVDLILSLPAEFDYIFLTSLLSEYVQPRKKINQLLSSGHIIRVKKGLYVRAHREGFAAPSCLRLSNLIYGPSYISLESALSFYQMIPEKVYEFMSVTSKRNKVFATPLGRFTYRYLNLKYYDNGYTQSVNSNGVCFLIATKEKALVDKIWYERKNLDPAKIEMFLLDDLRISVESIRTLNLLRLEKIGYVYEDPIVKSLIQSVKVLCQ